LLDPRRRARNERDRNGELAGARRRPKTSGVRTHAYFRIAASRLDSETDARITNRLNPETDVGIAGHAHYRKVLKGDIMPNVRGGPLRQFIAKRPHPAFLIGIDDDGNERRVQIVGSSRTKWQDAEDSVSDCAVVR